MLRRTVLTCCVIGLAVVGTTRGAEVDSVAINGSFEEDVNLDANPWVGWVTWGAEDGLLSEVELDETDFVDGTRSLRVEPVGAVNWHFIIINAAVPLEIGEEYTATFWAKADAARALSAKFKAMDNSIDWGFTDFVVTTDWEEYQLTGEALNDSIKFEFWVSGSETPVWLDFFNVYMGPYVAGVDPDLSANAVEPAGKLSTAWAELKAAR